jgi:hypothetical protein
MYDVRCERENYLVDNTLRFLAFLLRPPKLQRRRVRLITPMEVNRKMKSE